ncbi:hypothetical protein E3N88_21441 [Mikania micrantha]|uniref:Uncharacterized protein n=1 Tax=Mikania micrantha TaxID=192012 RepID=A0A5N6NMM7_9ASTR|nr:hypothetical protein E3N88_21441 [Mikania micrantha]
MSARRRRGKMFALYRPGDRLHIRSTVKGGKEAAGFTSCHVNYWELDDGGCIGGAHEFRQTTLTVHFSVLQLAQGVGSFGCKSLFWVCLLSFFGLLVSSGLKHEGWRQDGWIKQDDSIQGGWMQELEVFGSTVVMWGRTGDASWLVFDGPVVLV